MKPNTTPNIYALAHIAAVLQGKGDATTPQKAVNAAFDIWEKSSHLIDRENRKYAAETRKPKKPRKAAKARKTVITRKKTVRKRK